MMNFIVIGEMVLRLSEEFVENHSQIEWFKFREFRNMIAHNYFGIDAEEVWQIIKNDLPQFKISIEAILNKM
jgi:uncharacterized protein with HEPN domain